jgi:hypothetical protein
MASGAKALAQSRMSDKDIESLMKNLQEDAKKFQSSFNSAVQKDAKALVERFTKQTQGMVQPIQKQQESRPSAPERPGFGEPDRQTPQLYGNG